MLVTVVTAPIGEQSGISPCQKPQGLEQPYAAGLLEPLSQTTRPLSHDFPFRPVQRTQPHTHQSFRFAPVSESYKHYRVDILVYNAAKATSSAVYWMTSGHVRENLDRFMICSAKCSVLGA